MLTTMQMMQYFVKSGFGISDKACFGGTPDSPLAGLGQGSGAAPIGMRNMVTLATNAYKRLGHGFNSKSSITERIFLLAAIIYVDDTDLIHWGDFYDISDDDFHQKIQLATNDWGRLVEATGGALKREKSFYYLLSWKFSRGVPKLKTLSELPSTPMLIPQTDGQSVPIPLMDPGHTAKTLGVWNNPLCNPTIPLAELKNTGLDWVDRIKARPLERRDVWLSLECQQYPKWNFGLSSLYATPAELDKTINKVYYQALPLLGFNRNITSDYRTLPREFQGINLRQMSIEKLSKDLALLLRHWNSSSTLGQVFIFVYEAFQMEMGLDGNIFTRPFASLSHLATHSWFKLLWQYASQYKVSIIMNDPFHLKPTRISDIPLTDLFLPEPKSTQLILQRVRKAYGLHSLADLLLANGSDVNPLYLVPPTTPRSTRTFSWEQPIPSDISVWCSAIRGHHLQVLHTFPTTQQLPPPSTHPI